MDTINSYAANETEKKIIAAIDANREKLLAFARKTASCAEPGFFEFETAAAVQQFLE